MIDIADALLWCAYELHAGVWKLHIGYWTGYISKWEEKMNNLSLVSAAYRCTPGQRAHTVVT